MAATCKYKKAHRTVETTFKQHSTHFLNLDPFINSLCNSNSHSSRSCHSSAQRSPHPVVNCKCIPNHSDSQLNKVISNKLARDVAASSASHSVAPSGSAPPHPSGSGSFLPHSHPSGSGSAPPYPSGSAPFHPSGSGSAPPAPVSSSLAAGANRMARAIPSGSTLPRPSGSVAPPPSGSGSGLPFPSGSGFPFPSGSGIPFLSGSGAPVPSVTLSV